MYQLDVGYFTCFTYRVRRSDGDPGKVLRDDLRGLLGARHVADVDGLGGRAEGRTGRRGNERIDRRTNGQMDRGMDGRTDRQSNNSGGALHAPVFMV
jgi:hypothetical protein